MYVNILTPTYRLTVPWYNHGSDLVFCACLPLPPYKLSFSSLPFKDRLRRFQPQEGRDCRGNDRAREVQRVSCVCVACISPCVSHVSRVSHPSCTRLDSYLAFYSEDNRVSEQGRELYASPPAVCPPTCLAPGCPNCGVVCKQRCVLHF